MSLIKRRKKTTRSPRSVRKGGDLQKLHIEVTSPRIVMFQVASGLGKVCKICLFLAMIGVIIWGGYKGVQHLFIGNEKYLLRKISLQTNGKINEQRVTQLTGINTNANIFAIDTEEVKEKLKALPEVLECEVERRLPGTLQIHITERVPVVWIESSALGYPGRQDGGILADEHGITFPCEGAMWETARDLPVIVTANASADAFKHGHKMKHTDVMRAIHLIATFDRLQPRAQWMPERIILVNDYSMEAVCNDGSRAVFGIYDHERQLKDFVSIREHTLKTNRRVSHINLIPNKNIPVKFIGDPVLVKPKRRPAPVDRDQQEIQSLLDRN